MPDSRSRVGLPFIYAPEREFDLSHPRPLPVIPPEIPYTEVNRQRALRRIAEKHAREDRDQKFADYMRIMFDAFMARVARRFGYDDEQVPAGDIELVSSGRLPPRSWHRRRVPRFGLPQDSVPVASDDPANTTAIEASSDAHGRNT